MGSRATIRLVPKNWSCKTTLYSWQPSRQQADLCSEKTLWAKRSPRWFCTGQTCFRWAKDELYRSFATTKHRNLQHTQEVLGEFRILLPGPCRMGGSLQTPLARRQREEKWWHEYKALTERLRQERNLYSKKCKAKADNQAHDGPNSERSPKWKNL